MSKNELAKKILAYNYLLAETEDQTQIESSILDLAKAERIFSYKAELGIPKKVQEKKQLIEDGKKQIIDAIQEFIREDELAKGNNEFIQFHPGKTFKHLLEGNYGVTTYQFSFDYRINDNFINVVTFFQVICTFENKPTIFELNTILVPTQ